LSEPVSTRCALVRAELKSGPDEGHEVVLRFGDAGDEVPDVGDQLRLFHIEVPPGFESDVSPYSLADDERRAPMLWLGLAFAVLVVVAGRWRGLTALVGLGLAVRSSPRSEMQPGRGLSCGGRARPGGGYGSRTIPRMDAAIVGQPKDGNLLKW
jgi:hypothetical protein